MPRTTDDGTARTTSTHSCSLMNVQVEATMTIISTFTHPDSCLEQDIVVLSTCSSNTDMTRNMPEFAHAAGMTMLRYHRPQTDMVKCCACASLRQLHQQRLAFVHHRCIQTLSEAMNGFSTTRHASLSCLPQNPYPLLLACLLTILCDSCNLIWYWTRIFLLTFSPVTVQTWLAEHGPEAKASLTLGLHLPKCAG